MISTDACLKMFIQRPNPALLTAHNKLLEKSPAIYPFMTSAIKIASIAEGEFSFSSDDFFQGEVPSQLILGFVSSSAYSGNYKKSPFNFQHFDCNFESLCLVLLYTEPREKYTVPSYHLVVSPILGGHDMNGI